MSNLKLLFKVIAIFLYDYFVVILKCTGLALLIALAMATILIIIEKVGGILA